ncbi:MAG: hypothetical protein JSV29_03185 [Candidatus Bathyarchaeota archaeon]|nr:MAG: hypothetical protein JSV29_03185 [Candidatus Bathyarchaeota archaeon]
MSSHKLSKAAVALGGFLIFVGITMTSVFALAISGVMDISILETVSGNEAYRMLFVGWLLALGILDLVSGIILRYR